MGCRWEGLAAAGFGAAHGASSASTQRPELLLEHLIVKEVFKLAFVAHGPKAPLGEHNDDRCLGGVDPLP
jgi:hypothetical protein